MMILRQNGLYVLFLGTLLPALNGNALANRNESFDLNAKSGMYNPLENIGWAKITNYGNVQDIGSSHYLDVISHTDPNDPSCSRSSGMRFVQASVRTHETQHMLQCQIKKLTGRTDTSVEGIYYQDGNGLMFANPKTKVTDFISLIPDELREMPSPFQTYLAEQVQQYPNLNNIGYLFNEWASYRSNIIVNLQLEKAGIPEPDWSGHAANYAPHFFGYLAIAMHYLRTAEPSVLNDKQFKAVFALYAESTWKLMHETLNSPAFGTDNTIFGSRVQKLMDFYRNSPKFADVKNSLSEIYGADWVTNLMQ